MMITGNATTKTSSHSLKLRGTIPNADAKNGTYRIKKCRSNETAMARRSHGFTQGGMVSRLASSDLDGDQDGEGDLRGLRLSLGEVVTGIGVKGERTIPDPLR
jgi:hypothetical protein